MRAVTVRNIPDEVHRALKGRAAANGRSTEAEIREILRAAVSDSDGPSLIERLADIRSRHGGVDIVFDRDVSLAEPADLA